MVALDNGLALGADGLELDVQLSSDGIPVVIHDKTLDRTTGHTGPVRDFTADDLANVDAGYRFERDGSHPFRGRGIGVPTLAAVTARSSHPGLVNAAMMDGSVRGFSTDITQEMWRALATRSSGEVDATAP